MYCLSCREHTDTVNPEVISKGNRHRLTGGCATCGRKKGQFVGAGFLSEMGKKAFKTTANALRKKAPNVRKLKLGEFHYGNHNFTGPGTRIDLPEVQQFPPYNQIDACSRTHDMEFSRAFRIKNKAKREAAIRRADKKVIACYEQHPHADGYEAASLGINSKMAVEDVSPALAAFLLGNLRGR